MGIEKFEYFSSSLWKRLRGVNCACPNCGSVRFVVKDTKYLVTELRRCEDCRIMYRAPSDDPAENDKFYQNKYSQGFTTRLPDEAEIEDLLARNFATPEHSCRHIISLLTALGLGAGHRLFDYGCSWGYGSWQMMRAGMDVVAYEISRPRAAFAQKRLGIEIVSELPILSRPGKFAGSFDCFFSSHVIEHVPRPAAVMELAQALLKRGGYFVAITPNGSEGFRLAQPSNWHQVWGKVHPNLVDNEFWEHALGPRPILLASSPVDPELVRAFHERPALRAAGPLDRDELVCIARF